MTIYGCWQCFFFIFAYLLVSFFPRMKLSVTILTFLGLINILNAQQCSPGTYKDGKNCIDCPPGTFNSFSGALGKDLCQDCPTGTFNFLSGQTSPQACKLCPTLQSSTPGSSQCIACPPGFIIQPGDSTIPRCTACSISTFSPNANTFECTTCPKGKVSITGSASCNLCPPGFGPVLFDFGKEECRKCPFFRYNNGKLKECTRCPFGQRGNKKNGATQCFPCSLGKGFVRVSSTVCNKCDSGENALNRRPLCVKDGTPCPSNYFTDRKGICRTCTKLQRYISRKKKCRHCPSGSRSGGNLDTKCMPCPNGKVLVGDRCLCKEGFAGPEIGECTICPAGFRWFREFTGLGRCLGCKPGTFSSQGSVTCETCPPDMVQPESRQSSCFKCSGGLIASTIFVEKYGSTARFDNPRSRIDEETSRSPSRSICVSPQTNCPPGRERFVGGAGKLFCQASSCPPDTFEVVQRPAGFGRKVRLCLNCPKHTYLDKEAGKCVACEFNEVSDGVLVTECTKCPRNYDRVLLLDGTEKCVCETDGFGVRPKQLTLLPNNKCVLCPRGSTGNVGTSTCTPCPAGQTEGGSSCFVCRAGTFTNMAGTIAVGPTVSDCEKCPPGTTTYGVGETECVPIGGR